ncbi:DUF397 domain-containing protein [Streptomyces marincola]|uniref:DUF397 domain-containing protein n=1 Tax=Streptomyces marincola TaxID=2878388 RepID=A0A1W7CZA1_9ACTN|nr:DUF397 domain-containing protein [Streptomyces marincola]ARQ70128.1 hypothetical protein CAG99_15885 [Streptomyces marincola]
MDLYSIPGSGAPPRAYCGGNLGSEHETCVRLTELPGVDEWALSDSKDGGAGRELRFTTAELDAFARGWAVERGLAP